MHVTGAQLLTRGASIFVGYLFCVCPIVTTHFSDMLNMSEQCALQWH